MQTKRVLTLIGLLIAAGVLFWFFPLFHVVPAGAAGEGDRRAEFDAGDVAAAIWMQRLVPSFERAADAATVLTKIRSDPDQARREYGRSARIGRTALYFLRGRGTIVSVEPGGIGVRLDGDRAGAAGVVLQTGPLFRNTVRDAAGFVSASEYPNSQQFNAISAELNRIVESRVLPHLKQEARVGRSIEFVGCAEVLHVPRDIEPLKVVPVDVRLE